MNRITTVFRSEIFILLWMTLGTVGLFYSRSLLSIFFGGLGGIAVYFLHDQTYRQQLRQHKAAISFIGIWLVYALSGLWSTDQSTWLTRLNINTPFLAIIPGIVALQMHRGNILKNVLRIFMLIASLSIIVTLALYIADVEYYHKLYKMGQVMPTPVLHVRYSYFLGAPLCALWILSWQKTVLADKLSRAAVITYSVFTIIFLHLLAVRTGIAVVYGSIVLYTLYLAFFYKKYIAVLVAFIGLGLSATLAYQFLPTVQQKIAYIRWDLKQLQETGGSAHYSDNLRITSIQNGIHVANSYPILGAGMGDLEMEMNKQYRRHQPNFPTDANYPPVNQFIHWLASFGYVGGLLVLGLFLWPLTEERKYRAAFTFIYIATLLSCIGEATIELQLGKCFFLMWLGWLMHKHTDTGEAVESS